jgi:hypothetical protein
MSMPVLIVTPDEAAVDPKAWGKDEGRFSMMDNSGNSDTVFGAAGGGSNSAPLLLGLGIGVRQQSDDRRGSASGAACL